MSKTVTHSVSLSLVLFGVTVGVVVWLHTTLSDSANADRPLPVSALTFNKDIAPIIFENCVRCHRPGESAPFSLLGYKDVRTRARQIVEVTESRFMPPWLPEPGEFEGERRLTEEQIGMIRQWREEGAEEGKPSDLPPAPQFTKGWYLGEPDLVVRMSKPYTLAPEGKDVFRNFVMPVSVPQRKYVRAFELRPGNPKIVHHAVIMVDLTDASRRMDAKDPEPGYGGMDQLMSNAEASEGFFRGWTPGRVPFEGMEGVSWPLEKQCDLVLQLHMLPTGRPETIQSTIGLYFSEQPPSHHPLKLRLGLKTIDIPEGEANYVIQDSYTLPVDVTVLGILPHAHYLAKQMEGYAILPNGTTKSLIRINKWDFNWQDDYWYKQPIDLPKGTKLSMRFRYDNSAQNVRNPNQPPERVIFGAKSSDEMGDLWIQLITRNQEDYQILSNGFRRKEYYSRLAQLEKMLEMDPNEVSLRLLLSDLYIRAGITAKAIEHLEGGLRLNPDSADVHYLHFNLGNALLSAGKTDDAIQYYRKALKISPNYPEAHTNLANALKTQNRPEEAVHHYNEALRLKPDHATAHVNLGVIMMEKGEYGQAAVHYGRALEIRGETPALHHKLARALAAAGNIDESIAHFRKVIELQRNNFVAHFNLGRLLRSQSHRQEALVHYQEAMRLKNDWPLPINGAAWILATHPDPASRNAKEAVRLAEQAARLTQNRDPAVLDTLAASYAAAGRFDDAIKVAQLALERMAAIADPKLIEQVRSRLELYRKRQPYVESID